MSERSEAVRDQLAVIQRFSEGPAPEQLEMMRAHQALGRRTAELALEIHDRLEQLGGQD